MDNEETVTQGETAPAETIETAEVESTVISESTTATADAVEKPVEEAPAVEGTV